MFLLGTLHHDIFDSWPEFAVAKGSKLILSSHSHLIISAYVAPYNQYTGMPEAYMKAEGSPDPVNFRKKSVHIS